MQPNVIYTLHYHLVHATNPTSSINVEMAFKKLNLPLHIIVTNQPNAFDLKLKCINKRPKGQIIVLAMNVVYLKMGIFL